MKREILRTVKHVRDTPRVPIGDVLIKCFSVIEHCDNERGWETVCIHSNNSLLLVKIVLIEIKKKKKGRRKPSKKRKMKKEHRKKRKGRETKSTKK